MSPGLECHTNIASSYTFCVPSWKLATVHLSTVLKDLGESEKRFAEFCFYFVMCQQITKPRIKILNNLKENQHHKYLLAKVITHINTSNGHFIVPEGNKI